MNERPEYLTDELIAVLPVADREWLYDQWRLADGPMADPYAWLEMEQVGLPVWPILVPVAVVGVVAVIAILIQVNL